MDIQLKQELAAEAFELDRKLSKCLLNIRDNYLELGMVAWKLKQHKRYKLVEPEARSWEHFISLKFAGISRASLDNYSQVALTIGDEIGSRDIPLNRALDITRIVNRLPAEEQEGKIRELIESAEVLPKQGWDSAIAEESGKLPPDICSHERQENWSRCKDCHKFFKL
jgi:hypothetical protein